MYGNGFQLANTAKKAAPQRLTESARLSILKGQKHGKRRRFMSAFFLTGAVQTGKSTAIRSFLCANSALRPGGFLTVSVPTEAGFDVFLVPPHWTADDLTPEALVGRRGGTYEKYPENFDLRGCALLAPGGCDLVLMDELGRMELDALAFRAAVMAALDGDTPVLGVIKPEHNAFLDGVRSHGGVEVFPLTLENRNEAPAAIAAWYARISGGNRA